MSAAGVPDPTERDPLPGPMGRARPTRSTKRLFGATVLVCEGLVVLFAALAATGLTDLPTGAALGGGGALALLLIGCAGALRSPAGYLLGSVLQIWVLATGFVLAPMFALGALFALLWFVGLRLGGRVDREKAEREVLERRWRAEHGDGPVG